MSRDLRSGSSLEDLDPPFTEEEARQVLARAAEYERAMTAGVPAAHLRAAALEAGLSSAAFDSAVAAVREARGATSARGRSRRRTVAAVLGFALVLGAGTTARWRGAAPSGLGTPAPGASPGDAAPPARGAPGPERAAAPTCGA